MSTYTFTEDQIEAIAYVIKMTGCSFRMAYAACNMTNYNAWPAVQEIRKEQKKQLDSSFGPGFNDIKAFGFKD